MRKLFLAACAAACMLGAPGFASAQPINCSDPAAIASGLCQCLATVDPRIAAILAQYPAGGPGLRAAIARAVEMDPGLADAAVAAARRANPEQKQAIGAGLADAANYFGKIGLDWARGAEGRIRIAMRCADADTRVGFQIGEVPTLVQGIPGFNNAGASTNACVNGRPISRSGPPVPGCPD
jgi:hypothetical protein